MGIALLRKVGDRALSKLVPQVKAGACCPPDCGYSCYHRAKLWCCYNCACTFFCTGVGSC